MTFNARETGRHTGQPIGLITIERGLLVRRYTTGDRPFVYAGETYAAPGGVSHSEIRDSSQRAKNRLTVTLPIDLDVTEWWLPFPTAQRVLITCRSIHAGDSEAVIGWTGRVVSPKFLDTKLELTCEPSRSVTKARGSNQRWQRGCTVTLYSQGLGQCNVDPEEFRVTGTMTSLVGLQMEATAIDALPVGRLAGGFLRWERPDGELDFRTIMAHTGDTIILDWGTNAMPPGTSVDFFPGCAHTWEDCSYYANTDNYAGVLTIPLRSPHDGNPVQ